MRYGTESSGKNRRLSPPQSTVAKGRTIYSAAHYRLLAPNERWRCSSLGGLSTHYNVSRIDLSNIIDMFHMAGGTLGNIS